MLHKIFFPCLVFFILSGCVVSKKKYDALMLEKNQLSGQLDDKRTENEKLSSDLKSAISDYESMRYNLKKSNALMSDEVSDLMIKVTELQTQSEALNTQLKETLSAYKSNQQSGLQTSQALEKAQKQLAQLKRDTAGLHYSIKLAKERNNLIRKELSTSKEQLGNSHQKLKTIQEQAVKDQNKLAALEQHLIAQKETVESISKSFIALRKQLLSAKSNNEAIDPNKNNHIDRIARLLGHY